MNSSPLKRPHFDSPPIFEQAIALVFEPMQGFDVVDPGLFWPLISGEFPIVETATRLPIAVEHFDGVESQITFSALPAIQLPRAIFKSETGAELVQLQNDKFVFNWVRSAEDAQYPRFERTFARLWELFDKWATFFADRHGSRPQLRQCELTNVNVIPVKAFGDDFSDMHKAFVIDPFEWRVPGLVAETYVRQRVHRMVDDRDEPLGRLHSVISPVFLPDRAKAFQLELTARSAPNVKHEQQAREFFEHAHIMINAAFLASVTKRMREMWGEEDNGE